MEDKVVVLGSTGGQAGVSGQQLWQREGLRAKAFQRHSLPSLLSGYIHLKVGGARMSLLLSLASLGRWIL